MTEAKRKPVSALRRMVMLTSPLIYCGDAIKGASWTVSLARTGPSRWNNVSYPVTTMFAAGPGPTANLLYRQCPTEARFQLDCDVWPWEPDIFGPEAGDDARLSVVAALKKGATQLCQPLLAVAGVPHRLKLPADGPVFLEPVSDVLADLIDRGVSNPRCGAGIAVTHSLDHKHFDAAVSGDPARRAQAGSSGGVLTLKIAECKYDWNLNRPGAPPHPPLLEHWKRESAAQSTLDKMLDNLPARVYYSRPRGLLQEEHELRADLAAVAGIFELDLDALTEKRRLRATEVRVLCPELETLVQKSKALAAAAAVFAKIPLAEGMTSGQAKKLLG